MGLGTGDEGVGVGLVSSCSWSQPNTVVAHVSLPSSSPAQDVLSLLLTSIPSFLRVPCRRSWNRETPIGYRVAHEQLRPDGRAATAHTVFASVRCAQRTAHRAL